MSESPICMAGVAQKKITPKLGAHLGGYFYDRIATSVKSDLYTRAMVFERDGKRLAIVSNDLICSIAEITDPAKQLIAERCGVGPDAVMVCATHTHTGPEIRNRKDLTFGADPGYNAELIQRIAGVVEEACQSMFEATVWVGSAEAEGYSMNKLRRLKSGDDLYDLTGKWTGQAENFMGFAGPLDTSVQTLCLRDGEKRVRGLAVNFAAHPNSKGEDIWAEWPGETARCIASVYGEDVPCLVLQGTAGDVDCRPGLRRENVGKGVAGAAVMANERVERPVENVRLDCRLETLKIACWTRTPEMAAVIEGYKQQEELGNLEKAAITCYETWDKDGTIMDVPVQCLRIGDVAVVGLPAEIFTALGLEIKRYSPARQTFVVELANTRASGYVPPIEQAHRGGYGERPIQTRWLAPEAGCLMVDSALKSLHELYSDTSNRYE